MMRKWYILWICTLTCFLSSCMPVNHMTPDYIVSEMSPDTALTVLEKCLPKMVRPTLITYTDIGVYRDRFEYTELLVSLGISPDKEVSHIIYYFDITKVKITHIPLPIYPYVVEIYTTSNSWPECGPPFKDKEDAKVVCEALTVLSMREN